MVTNETPPRPEDIRPAKEVEAEYPHLYPNDNTLTWQIRNRKTNGLDDFEAVLIIGKEAYLNVPRYMMWISTLTRGRKSVA